MSTSHPSFDPEEAAIVAGLPVQGAEPDEAPDGTKLPASDTDDGATAEAEAALAAAAAQSPAPAPAPAAAPADAPAPAPAPTAAAPADAPAPTPAPAPAPDGNVKAALRASRQNEKRLREQLEATRAENERLKQGKTVETDTEDFSDEELAELEENFPVQAKLVRQNRALKAQVEETRRLATQHDSQATEFEPPTYPPEIQEVIDTVPDLLAWQHNEADQDKFAMAVEFDSSLKVDPRWRGKTAAERFAEAARLTRETLGQPAASAPPAAPAAPRTDPAAALAQAPVETPKGVGDFRGGGPANAPALDYRRMTDQDILASLPVTD